MTRTESSPHIYEIVNGPSVWSLGIQSLLGNPLFKDMRQRVVYFNLNFTHQGSFQHSIKWAGLVHLLERKERWAPDHHESSNDELPIDHCCNWFMVVHFPHCGGTHGIWTYGYYDDHKRTGWLDRLPEHLFNEHGMPHFLFHQKSIVESMLTQVPQ